MADAIELDGVELAVNESILTAHLTGLPLWAFVKRAWSEANPGAPPIADLVARWGAYQLIMEWAAQIATLTDHWDPDERKAFCKMLTDFILDDASLS